MITAVIVPLSATIAAGLDGALDPTFGNGGVVLTQPIGSPLAGNSRARTLVHQADGKLVAAGVTFLNGFDDFALLRVNPDGSRDTSFGVGGQVTTAIGAGHDRIEALIQQADGKLVAAGTTSAVGQDFALARYNPDGSLDPSFDGDGMLQTDFGIGPESAYAIIQQPDGKLVVAGSGYNNITRTNDLALARYTLDGSLDPTFGGGSGQVRTAVHDYAVANALIQQSDGKLVVAGYAKDFNEYDFVLARYNPDGSLDTSFGGDGIVITPVGPFEDHAQALIQQTDGKLVAAGNGVALVRYNTDGSLDTSFDGDGIATATVPGATGATARALVQQSDGRLVTAGLAQFFPAQVFALARFNADGSLDTTFDGDGVATAAVAPSEEEAEAIIVQPDGKLVAAGYGRNASVVYDFALARFHADGSLDTGFDGDGTLLAAITRTDARLSALVRQADGKLVAVGTTRNGSFDDFVVVRYNPDGSLDPTFSGDGIALTDIATRDDMATAVALQSDGKIVVTGEATARHSGLFTRDVALARYNGDGSIDFKAAFEVGTGTDFGQGLIVQADGKLLVAGGAVAGSSLDSALLRFTSVGAPDASFDGDGRVVTSVSTSNDSFAAVLQQSDGRLVAAGQGGLNGTDAFAVARYDADGSLDPSFDGDGMLLTDFAIGHDQAVAILQQTDGKLVAVGRTGNAHVGLVRYHVDGSLDASFDGDGKVITALGNDRDDVLAAILQPDDRIVVAGQTRDATTSGIYGFAVVRYRSDGSLDPSFDGDGKVIVRVGTGDARAQGLVRQPDGKLVAGGWAYDRSGNRVFALVRLLNSVCGDGVVSGSEQCDLGNANGAPDACCDAACAFAAATSSCRPSTGACDPGETCSGDAAACPPDQQSTCTPTPTSTVTETSTASATSTATMTLTQAAIATQTTTASHTASPTETPSPTASPTATPVAACPALPAASCRTAGKSLLLLQQRDGSGDRLLWKWLRGATTTLDELGDPITTTSYALCLYDLRGNVAAAEVAPGSAWDANSKGFRYSDPFASQTGLVKIDLKSSDSGKTKIMVTGKGANLPDPPLPLQPPVTIQLRNRETGLCWQTAYDTAQIVRSGPDQFRAKHRQR